MKPTGYCLNCNEPVSEGKLYCSHVCGKSYRYRTRYGVGRDQAGEKRKRLAKKVGCTCHQYSTCLRCRNAERRRAWRENRTPIYLQNVIAACVAA